MNKIYENDMRFVPLLNFYNKYKIQVPFVKWNDKTFFRISFQVYNSKDDIRYLIESLIDFKK